MSFDEVNEKIWSIGAEIFIPAAASRLLSQNQLDQMIEKSRSYFMVQMFLLLIKRYFLDLF